jgi:aryl-alcohol dehydrogenase-like predicted oxidoreductase
MAADLGLGVTPWGPLAGGVLTGKYSRKDIGAQPGEGMPTSPILGARTADQLRDNLGCLDFELGPEEMNRLDDVSAIQLGFPHDFLSGPMVRQLVHGGVEIAHPS